MVQQTPAFKNPRIVFADHNYGFISQLIKGRTKGNWSHVMWEIEPGIVATQTFTGYKKDKLAAYMKPGNRLKFIELDGLNQSGRDAILKSIKDKLAKPWWKTRYDFLGIIGQATGLKFIQNPWLEFCSEDTPAHLIKAYKEVGETGFPDPWPGIIQSLPKEMSPQSFDEYQKRFKKWFPLAGYWNSDE